MRINECIASLATYPCNTKPLYLYYILDTATEEGFRYAEHHDAKIQVFKNVGLFRVFANWVTYGTAQLKLDTHF